ncbi:hypothetical protein [Saccharopolyspora endophytica]|uniref:Uncharacterized protein n=1 Tax=Saccharopolyspora endophytica TaxID=543886 RepID=A0ABS5DE93_9PSEU|nr:hypothetical protein [Saccharopolyspora endophytica]MBQ0924605.1 hypothetical protein [Saccharopolyspora endophytica]
MDAAEFARRMNQTTTPTQVEDLVNELHDQHDRWTATQIVTEALPMVTPIDERD